MIVFPNCKINLGLHVTRKRADGFHDIETVFYPLPLRDTVEVVGIGSRETGGGRREAGERSQEEKDSGKAGAPQLTIYGLQVKGNADGNLCVKAWYLLKKDFPALPVVAIHLLKNIPIGAGLGGGSADGAFTLQLLNKRFDLRLAPGQLSNYAIELGSDCPFFILNTPCYATGRGENLLPIPLDLAGCQIIIVNPGIHIPTAWAFSKLSPSPPAISLLEVMQQPPATWKAVLCNDFEPAVFAQYPEIRAIKEKLYAAGAIYAAMSGSGSTVYGLFLKNALPVLSFPPTYTVIHL